MHSIATIADIVRVSKPCSVNLYPWSFLGVIFASVVRFVPGLLNVRSLHHRRKNNMSFKGTPAKGGKILVLPGDHVGPEVVAEALKVLDIIEQAKGVKFEREFDLCGGCSLDKHKDSVTEEVLQKCEQVDAVFFGSAGGPEWGTAVPNPESGKL